MAAASKEKHTVTLPEGVSLRRVAVVLRDAWEADPRRWMNTPMRLREGAPPQPVMPVPQDAMDLFRLLDERRVDYLLVGGMAMLTYVKGRNTKDVDLLMSVAALEKLPELKIEDRNDLIARRKFKSIQVDLLLTTNPLFKTVAEKFATKHSFEELTVPTATVEGMILLKLFALPLLYQQKDLDWAMIYEADVKLLLARYQPEVEPLFRLLEPHVSRTDLKEFEKIVSDENQRIARIKERFQN
jgi:hypothetical protein